MPHSLQNLGPRWVCCDGLTVAQEFSSLYVVSLSVCLKATSLHPLPKYKNIWLLQMLKTATGIAIDCRYKPVLPFDCPQKIQI